MGFTPGKDFEIVFTGRQRGGRDVDALLGHPPVSQDLARLGWKILFDMRPLNFPFQLSSVVASRRWLDAHPGAATAYLQGHAEGLYRFVADPDFGVEVYRRWTDSTGDETLRAGQKVFAKEFELPPYPTVPGIAAILQTMVDSIPGAAGARGGLRRNAVYAPARGAGVLRRAAPALPGGRLRPLCRVAGCLGGRKPSCRGVADATIPMSRRG